MVLIPFIDEDLMISALAQVREGGREEGREGGKEGVKAEVAIRFPCLPAP